MEQDERLSSGNEREGDASRKHLRGSSVLLAGRMLALVMSFAVHVLTVRALSQADYGAFAYALTVAGLGTSLALLCLDKTLARFLPVYHEQGEYGKLFGTLRLAGACVGGIGLAWALFFLLFRGWLGAAYFREPEVLRLVTLLAVLAPLDGMICLCGTLFAVFAKPRDIFFTRHLLGPALHAGLIALFLLGRSDVGFLAAGYVAVTVVNGVVQAWLLLRVLRREGLLREYRAAEIETPAREIFAFSGPLLVQDLVFLMRSSLVVVALEHAHGTDAVALFRAVFPLARLNLLVFETFTILFMPMAARMWARGEREAIHDLYWSSAAWIAVLTFPIFAVSFSLAGPLTELLYGARYAQSAWVLAALALGHYFTAALGFNGLTLQVFGQVRYLMIANLVGAALGLALFALLIPPLGALGAALATAGTIIGQNLLFQVGLGRGGVRPVEPRYAPVYVLVALSGGGLLALTVSTGWSVWIGLPAAAAVSLALLWANRRLLALENSFPELRRLPLARRLLGTAAA